jgi:hypothetical protein
VRKIIGRNHIVVFFCAFVILATFGCASEKEGEHAKEQGDITVVLGPAKYIGSDKCKECHWREHDSWKHTLHSKFTQLASTYTVLGDFDENNTLSVKVTTKATKYGGTNIKTTMFTRDGKYYINTAPTTSSMIMKSSALSASTRSRTI